MIIIDYWLLNINLKIIKRNIKKYKYLPFPVLFPLLLLPIFPLFPVLLPTEYLWFVVKCVLVGNIVDDDDE